MVDINLKPAARRSRHQVLLGLWMDYVNDSLGGTHQFLKLVFFTHGDSQLFSLDHLYSEVVGQVRIGCPGKT